jgi:hypothetical protein
MYGDYLDQDVSSGEMWKIHRYSWRLGSHGNCFYYAYELDE